MKAALAVLLLSVPAFAGAAQARAAVPETVEVRLKNGDRLRGEMASESGEALKLRTEAMGEIRIERRFVEAVEAVRPVPPPQPDEEEPKQRLVREISAGYNATAGNTNSQEAALRANVDVLNERDEILLKSLGIWSAEEKETNALKARGSVRAARRLGESRAPYVFGQGEAEHNRFADIAYRLTPSAGLGYWLSDRPDWRIRVECAAGMDWTDFRDETEGRSEWVLIPSAFAQWRPFRRLKATEEVFVFPSLTESGEYRLRSETALTYPVLKGFYTRLSFFVDYNSNPANDTKKSDSRLLSSLVYSF